MQRVAHVTNTKSLLISRYSYPLLITANLTVAFTTILKPILSRWGIGCHNMEPELKHV